MPSHLIFLWFVVRGQDRGSKIPVRYRYRSSFNVRSQIFKTDSLYMCIVRRLSPDPLRSTFGVAPATPPAIVVGIDNCLVPTPMRLGYYYHWALCTATPCSARRLTRGRASTTWLASMISLIPPGQTSFNYKSHNILIKVISRILQSLNPHI